MGRALDELVSKIVEDDLSQSLTETNLQAMSSAEIKHFSGYDVQFCCFCMFCNYLSF